MELSHQPGSPSQEQRRGLRREHYHEVAKLDLVAEGPSHFQTPTVVLRVQCENYSAHR
jgi:hypothetical protein